ncbi:hypothetical protein HK405_012173 [Cladochytrium tenue]|nr:hypothetical protein HK405_012173 [Cladochytrium tenue]
MGLTKSSAPSGGRAVSGPVGRFISPLLDKGDRGENRQGLPEDSSEREPKNEIFADERMRNIDPQMAENILNEIMDHGQSIGWDDIAGLEHAKNTIKEVVVWPMLRPDIFTGIRGPPKGTGKTMIGKCIASQSGATFFSISASSLTSKWVGDGEKMVRALFAVSRVKQPSVIFIDEIDSLLTQRVDGEAEASRRIKTEFLVRYIPLPEAEARRRMVVGLLSKQLHELESSDIDEIIRRTDGYSGSDMDGLVREAALGPIRDIRDIRNVSTEDVRAISLADFEVALTQVRASVSDKDLDLYLRFDSEYGSVSRASTTATGKAPGPK